MPTSSSTAKKDLSRKFSSHPLMGSERFAELVGFLLLILGLLVLCSLVSYFPADPSLDASGQAAGVIHNWIGLTGAYGADFLEQLLGWPAYVIPISLFFVGFRLVRTRPLEAPRSKLFGLVLLILSLGALLHLFPYTPQIHGVIHGSGLVGYLVAIGLVNVLNPLGAAIVAGTLFLSSLFLVTRFSFSALMAILQRRFAFLGRLAARWQDWRESRRAGRLRRQIERTKAAGRQPVVMQEARQLSPRAERKNEVSRDYQQPAGPAGYGRARHTGPRDYRALTREPLRGRGG